MLDDDSLRKASRRLYKARSGGRQGEGSLDTFQALTEPPIACVQIADVRLGFVQGVLRVSAKGKPRRVPREAGHLNARVNACGIGPARLARDA